MYKNLMGNMLLDASILKPCNIDYLNNMLLDSDGLLKPVKSSELIDIEHEALRYFCHVHGFYSIPTVELIEHLSGIIGNETKVLEIGAGNGVYGRSLGIKSTDNFMQHPKNYRKFGGVMESLEHSGVPPVEYGPNVEEMDGIEAVRKYKPRIVLASWVTHKYTSFAHHRGGNMYGVNFPWIIDRKGVDKLILVGNDDVHKNNIIMDAPHSKTSLSNNIFSRAKDKHKNFVYVWDCSEGLRK